MRRWCRLVVTATLFTAAGLTAGCEPMPPSGDLLAPVRVEAVAPAPAQAPPVAPPAIGDGTLESARPGGFDFDREDRPDDRGGEPGATDPVELQARFFGADPEAYRKAQQPAAPPQAAVQAPAPPAAAPVPQIGEWDPNQPLPDGSFGIRLLATLTDVQPPRAVIGLPDGSEQVVQPGAFLEEQRLVVMAIGRDVVQVARIVPQGYYARIDTQNVQALFPTQRREITQ